MNELTLNKEQNVDYERKAVEYLDAMGMTRQLSDAQKKLFVELASAYQLNPFKREIYPIVYKNKNGSNDISLVTGYEVYIQRANQSGLLDGWSWDTEGEVVFKTDLRTTKDGKNYQTRTIDRDKSTLKATVIIHRKDWKHPFIHSITIDEFSGESGIWLQSPKFMLKKTCASQAFRLCFSKELSGIPYTSDESSLFKPAESVEYQELTVTEVPQPPVPEVCEPQGSNLPEQIVLLAEHLFRQNFLTEKKKDSIIGTARNSLTKEGLLLYLKQQLELFSRLASLTDRRIITEQVKVEIYKMILSAKSQDLGDIATMLTDLESGQEVA